MLRAVGQSRRLGYYHHGSCGTLLFFTFLAQASPTRVELRRRPMIAHVLLVNASPWVTSLIKVMLQRAGCRVVHATSVAQARHMLESRRPDLMVLDERLPDGSPADVVEAAFQIHGQVSRDHAHHLPTLVLTTQGSHGGINGTADVLQRGDWMHAPDVVCVDKPIQIDTFETLVRGCLESSRASQDGHRDRVEAALPRSAEIRRVGAVATPSGSVEAPWIDGDWGDSPPLPNRSHPDATAP